MTPEPRFTGRLPSLQRRLTVRLSEFLELLYCNRGYRVFSTSTRPEVSPYFDWPIQMQTASTGADAVSATMKAAGTWHRDEADRRKARGDICYAVMDAQRCVHYAWLTRTLRDFGSLGLRVELPAKHAWIYDCFTVPSHRGRSIFPHVLIKIVGDMHRQAAERVWVDARVSNDASIRGILKAGFEEAALLQRTFLFTFIRSAGRRVALNDNLSETLDAMPIRWV
ncbi:MAG TPA: GNAT family N-acetyltransferase [Elusimicrobiota bacterium]|nr:GNAT family N-acetyltransferase [Elusimicrobiota bacterium]